MEVKLFIREDCPECPAAIRACEGLVNVSVYDLSEMHGMVEASSLGVQQTPSVVVVDSAGHEVAGWRGEAPEAADIRAVLAN